MPYIKGNGASSRYGIMGVGQPHQPGPSNNYRTSEETNAEVVQRRQQFTQVPITEFDAVAHTLRTARAMAEGTTSDQEVQHVYGQHCRYIEAKVAEFSSGLQQFKEYGQGGVILPIQLWTEMTQLAEWCMPVIQGINQMLQPLKLVVQNGQTVEQARQLGSYAEVER